MSRNKPSSGPKQPVRRGAGPSLRPATAPPTSPPPKQRVGSGAESPGAHLPKDYARTKRGLYAEYARTYDADRRELYGSEALERWNGFLTGGITAGMSILDAGCGTGVHLRTAARLAAHTGVCTGLDISPEMLSRAQRRLRVDRHAIKGAAADNQAEGGQEEEALHVATEPAKTLCTLADLSRTIPLPAGIYDWVICANLLEELPDPERCLHDLARVLRPGGTLAAAVCCHTADNAATAHYVAAAAARGWQYRSSGEVSASFASLPWCQLDSAAVVREPVAALPIGKPRFPLFADFVTEVRAAGLSPEEVGLEMLLVKVRKI